MEIDRIQLNGTLKVERSGGEQQRRRRQDYSQEFKGELEQESESTPEQDRLVRESGTALPIALDIVSIAGARRELPAAQGYGSPLAAYRARQKQAEADVPPAAAETASGEGNKPDTAEGNFDTVA